MRQGRAFIVLMLLAMLGVSEAAAQEPRPAPPRPAPEARPAPAPRPPQVASRGWLGIIFDDARTPAEGVIVREVHPESPAHRAGVRSGDRGVQINGRAATSERFRELRLQPGDTVRLRLRREGERDRDLEVVAGARPAASAVEVRRRGTGPDRVVIIDGDTVNIPLGLLAARADSVAKRISEMFADSLPAHFRELQRRFPDFQVRIGGDTTWVFGARPGESFLLDMSMGGRAVAGAEFAELNAGLAEYFRGAREGLLVLRVAPGTPAARAGLQEGDVVVRAEGETIRTVSDLRRAVGRAQRRDMRLDVIRQGEPREVRLRWER